jgi:hypothetical protein
VSEAWHGTRLPFGPVRDPGDRPMPSLDSNSTFAPTVLSLAGLTWFQ